MSDHSAGAEPRRRCPVCVGRPMEKVKVGREPEFLTLDHCLRCGGTWFEKGETQWLALLPPDELARAILPPPRVVVPPCRGCDVPLERAAERCAGCGRENVVDCPGCRRPMRRRAFGPLSLDLCARCPGVWFDYAELTGVWTLGDAIAAEEAGTGVAAALRRRLGASLDRDDAAELGRGAAHVSLHGASAMLGGGRSLNYEGQLLFEMVFDLLERLIRR